MRINLTEKVAWNAVLVVLGFYVWEVPDMEIRAVLLFTLAFGSLLICRAPLERRELRRK